MLWTRCQVYLGLEGTPIKHWTCQCEGEVPGDVQGYEGTELDWKTRRAVDALAARYGMLSITLEG